MSSPSEQSKFQSLGLNEKILSAINTLGYETPTPIQTKTIPYVLQGKDVLGQAHTGTGKTAAFALPLLNNMDLIQTKKPPQVLVLTPTRELAIQVAESFEKFAKNIHELQIVSIYGGQEYGRQIQALRRGVHVVVGTAGRVMDHMRRGTLKLDNLTSLVLDEADEMLRMGFIDDVKWVLSHTPEKCQRLLFSATMPHDVMNIVNKHLRTPHKVQIKSQTTVVPTIYQRFLVIRGLSKIEALDRILEAEDVDAVLVFVKTKSSTVQISDNLKSCGYLAAAINGDMQQNQREHIIQQIKLKKINILVATDVVARGLDVEGISHVINFDLPQDNESYVHRIGRTGRAGKKGDAISLIYPRDIRQLRLLERSLRQKITEMDLPNTLEITKKRVKNFKHTLAETIRHKNLKKFKEIIEDFQTEYGSENEDILPALVYMAQGEKKLFLKEITINSKTQPYQTQRPGYENKKSYRNKNTRNFQKSSTHNRKKIDTQMSTYRVEVGLINNIEVRNLVGAIANETKINSSHIGHIKLFDKFSTIDLPSQIPKETFESLQKIWVGGKKLEIKPLA